MINLGNLAMDVLDLEMVINDHFQIIKADDLKNHERKLNSHATWMVNSCQDGFLF